jgi:hypothetical protein
MSNVPLTIDEMGELIEFLRKNPLLLPGPATPREFFQNVVKPARAAEKHSDETSEGNIKEVS